METKQKTAYFEWLRLLASAAVVLMHTAARRWLSISHTLPEWQALTRWDSLVRWPVPIFIMVTGALFLPRKTELKTMLRSYIPRMAVCYLVWSAVYACYSGELTAKALATGYYHLWYLPFLCGVYLALPFLQKIAEDDRLAGALTVLALSFGCAVPWLMDLGALLVPEYGPVFAAVRGHLNYAFFLDLLAALMLGHWLHSHELPRRHRLVLYVLGLLSVAGTMVLTLRLSAVSAAPVSLFFEHSSPLNICTAAALFVFAKYNLTTLPAWVARTAKCSFGIYLSHALVIDLLADGGYHVLTWDPVWSVPVLSAAVFAISLALTAVLKRVPLLGKYLV
ncbi:MAG: acyltransferase family protein [Oscillospiraceae bacterium]|nr:acyltransferase family protein [Oscillospiraceae bacterium]